LIKLSKLDITDISHFCENTNHKFKKYKKFVT